MGILPMILHGLEARATILFMSSMHIEIMSS